MSCFVIGRGPQALRRNPPARGQERGAADTLRRTAHPGESNRPQCSRYPGCQQPHRPPAGHGSQNREAGQWQLFLLRRGHRHGVSPHSGVPQAQRFPPRLHHAHRSDARPLRLCPDRQAGRGQDRPPEARHPLRGTEKTRCGIYPCSWTRPPSPERPTS